MNAKQRRVADKVRQRASLDADGKVRELEEKRRLFAEECRAQTAQIEASRQRLVRDQEENKESAVRFQAEMEEARLNFVRQSISLKDANVVREVLLLLELDEDPAAIALKIRQQFGLLIPEW